MVSAVNGNNNNNKVNLYSKSCLEIINDWLNHIQNQTQANSLSRMPPVSTSSSSSSSQQHQQPREVKLKGHVGFDTLPDQIVSKTVSEGFCFNIMVIGETGIGKSTLLDTLFNTRFDWQPSSHHEQRLRLQKSTYELQESNVRLKLSLVESVGYGDQINKEDSHVIVSQYLDAQFEAYLQEELKIKRNFSLIQDSRVHVCLYLLCPTGHSIKPIDLAVMKQLERRVNVIPVIAKSDTIAKNELAKFKENIMHALKRDVKIYQFPTDDEKVAEINSAMNVCFLSY